MLPAKQYELPVMPESVLLEVSEIRYGKTQSTDTI